MEFKNFTQNNTETEPIIQTNDYFVKEKKLTKEELRLKDLAQDSLNVFTSIHFKMQVAENDEKALFLTQNSDLKTIEEYWKTQSNSPSANEIVSFDKFFPGFRDKFNSYVEEISAGVTKDRFYEISKDIESIARPNY